MTRVWCMLFISYLVPSSVGCSLRAGSLTVLIALENAKEPLPINFMMSNDYIFHHKTKELNTLNGIPGDEPENFNIFLIRFISNLRDWHAGLIVFNLVHHKSPHFHHLNGIASFFSVSVHHLSRGTRNGNELIPKKHSIVNAMAKQVISVRQVLKQYNYT